MKILIITMNVGRTAPGIVFERLIYGLSKHHEIDVLTSDFDPSMDLTTVRQIVEVKRIYVHPRIEKALIGIFGKNPFDTAWASSALRLFKKKKHDEYDLVFSFLSFHHYAALFAGLLFSKAFKAKLAIYSVDAIPAPLGWSENDTYFWSINKMAAKYLAAVDFFFSANSKMLTYQLTKFKLKRGIITGVILNPAAPGKVLIDDDHSSEDNLFLYTGGIYGVRRPEYVLGAFKKILTKYPNSTLEFVGSNMSPEVFGIFNEEELKKVLTRPFTRDLSSFYNRATALLDIDADLENDVFLSSKIVNYINIAKVIICETSKGSPSYELFSGIKSILHCDHNVDSIVTAMEIAINNKGKFDFTDRKMVLEEFDINTIIKGVNEKLLAGFG